MNQRMLTSFVLILAMALIVCGGDVAERSSHVGTTKAASNRIEEILRAPTESTFGDDPLTEVLKCLEDQHHIKIWIDTYALNDEGVNPDTHVSLESSDLSLDATLNLLLEPLALTYVNEDGVLKVMTLTKADERLSTRVYPVGDLVDAEEDPVALMRAIMQTTSGKWQQQDGEGGAMTSNANTRSLVIRQTQKVHREIEGIVSALRKSKTIQGYVSIPINPNDPDRLLPGGHSQSRPETIARPTASWQRPRIHSSE